MPFFILSWNLKSRYLSYEMTKVKNSIFRISSNKSPWKFFKCFGYAFLSFVTCKMFWSGLILLTSVWKVSPINMIWSENVIFKCFDTVWKNWKKSIFFIIFQYFFFISPNFERAGAHAKCSHRFAILKSQNKGSQNSILLLKHI